MHKIFFDFPDFDAFVSGGNIYNKRFEQVLLEKFDVKKVNDINSANFVITDTIFLNNTKTNTLINADNVLKAIIVHHLKYFEDNSYTKEFGTLKNFDLFIANSDFTSKALEVNGIKTDRITIIEPPVHSPSAPSIQQKMNSVNAVMAANWIERKGYYEMFNALKTFKSVPDNLSITIFGDRTLNYEYYKKCIDLLNESSALQQIIKASEMLPPKLMFEKYQNYNVFISASKMETYGMSVKEALVNGLYVLALNRGNIPYLVNEPIKGKLFSDVNSLVSYLIHIANDNSTFNDLLKIKLFPNLDKDKFENQVNEFVKKIKSMV